MTQFKYPEEIEQHLRLLGERIRMARVRRRWSREELAARAGVERRTIARLEEGASGVGLGVFMTVLWIMGLFDCMSDIAAPESDKAGAFLDKQRQPKHVHGEAERNLDF